MRLLIERKDGVLIEVVENLNDYNLQKPIAADVLLQEIQRTVQRIRSEVDLDEEMARA